MALTRNASVNIVGFKRGKTEKKEEKKQRKIMHEFWGIKEVKHVDRETMERGERKDRSREGGRRFISEAICS